MQTAVTQEQRERDRKALAFAKEYLLNLRDVTCEILDTNTCPNSNRPQDFAKVFEQLLRSAATAGMRHKVIFKTIDQDMNNLAPLLCDFNPHEIVEKYHDNYEQLLTDVAVRFDNNGQIHKKKRSIWPKYCQTILSAAAFLSQFEDSSEFHKWVEFFDQDDRKRVSLPLLLGWEIDGVGFALACDFLKEMGYENFGKPDRQLKAIFKALELSATERDRDVFKAIVRIARNNGTTPYYVDKVFWLIGSGNFGRSGLQVGGHRDPFIAEALKHLQ